MASDNCVNAVIGWLSQQPDCAAIDVGQYGVLLMRKMYCLVFLILLIFFAASGCTGSNRQIQHHRNPDRPENLEGVVLNMQDLQGRSARLVNGKFEGDHLSVRVLHKAFADFDRDGSTDGVIAVFENTGGTGNYRALCLLFRRKNRWVHADTVFIGDRIRIVNLSIKGGNKIELVYLDRGKRDTYSVDPYLRKTIRFKVANGVFKRLNG